MRTIGPSHTETKQRILAIARKLVIKQGHTGLSLREIAREAGFSAPSLYEYFESKDAIVEAIAAEIAASLRLAMARSTEGIRNKSKAVIELGLAYVAWAKRHPQDFMLVFSRLGSKRRSLGAALAVASPYTLVIEAVTAARDAGAIARKANIEDVAYSMWAAVHGMAMLQLTQLTGFAADFAAADRAALEALFAGFA